MKKHIRILLFFSVLAVTFAACKTVQQQIPQSVKIPQNLDDLVNHDGTSISPDSIQAIVSRMLDPFLSFNSKEQERANWISESRFADYDSFDTQYRVKAMRKIRAKDSPIPRETGDWKSIGPHQISGRIISSALHPLHENIIWIGSASGGLWKSEDTGESWRHVSNNLPSMAIYDIAIHPTKPDTMFIGTGTAVGVVGGLGASRGTARGSGVFISVDGGKEWDEAGRMGARPVDAEGELVNTRQLVWHESLPDSIYLASDAGLWRYLIKEERWEAAFTGEHNALMNADVRSIIIDPSQRGILTAALHNDGVVRSYDHGKSWQFANTGFPQLNRDTSLVNITQPAHHPDTLYANIASKDSVIIFPRNPAKRDTVVRLQSHIYKTTNGGQSWNLLCPRNHQGAPSKSVCKTPQFVQVLEVSPFDSNLLFAGGVNLYRSTNGAKDWMMVNNQPGSFDVVHVDQHGIDFSETNPDLVYALTDGGLYQSLSRGLFWIAKNSGLTTLQVYSIASSPHDSVTLSIGVQDQGTLVTNSLGQTWTKRVTGDGGKTLFDTETENIIYATAQYGNHWKIVKGQDPRRIMRGINDKPNNGQTSLWIAPFEIDPESPQILYSATLREIFRTENGGEDWVPVAQLDTVSIIRADLKNPNLVYAYAKKEGQIYRSTDRGQSWSKPDCPENKICSPGMDVFDLEPDPDETGVLYASRTTQEDQIWRSLDRGATWENYTSDSYLDLRLPVQDIEITPREVTGAKQIYLGTDLGVFRRREGEKEWTFIGGKVPFAIVTQMQFNKIDRTLRVATFGRGVWKLKVPVDQDTLSTAGSN